MSEGYGRSNVKPHYQTIKAIADAEGRSSRYFSEIEEELSALDDEEEICS